MQLNEEESNSSPFECGREWRHVVLERVFVSFSCQAHARTVYKEVSQLHLTDKYFLL